MSHTTWNLDPTHSSIAFTIRHMMVAKVHGRFNTFEGSLETNAADDFSNATATVTIDANSIDTQVPPRDAHLRSADFFDVEKFPTLTFKTNAVSGKGQSWSVKGELTLHGVTREVTLDTEFLGRFTDPFGTERLGFSASVKLNRKDFGLNWNKAVEAGGVLVGETVDVQLELQAVPAAKAQAA